MFVVQSFSVKNFMKQREIVVLENAPYLIISNSLLPGDKCWALTLSSEDNELSYAISQANLQDGKLLKKAFIHLDSVVFLPQDSIYKVVAKLSFHTFSEVNHLLLRFLEIQAD